MCAPLVGYVAYEPYPAEPFHASVLSAVSEVFLAAPLVVIPPTLGEVRPLTATTWAPLVLNSAEALFHATVGGSQEKITLRLQVQLAKRRAAILISLRT